MFRPPAALNEPVLDYAPGSTERAALQERLDRMAAERVHVPMVIGGESAGAHLCAVTLLRLRARGLARRIAGAVLNYGAYDMRMTPSMAAVGPATTTINTPPAPGRAASPCGRSI